MYLYTLLDLQHFGKKHFGNTGARHELLTLENCDSSRGKH